MNCSPQTLKISSNRTSLMPGRKIPESFKAKQTNMLSSRASASKQQPRESSLRIFFPAIAAFGSENGVGKANHRAVWPTRVVRLVRMG
jgi:hypothetical protein